MFDFDRIPNEFSGGVSKIHNYIVNFHNAFQVSCIIGRII